MIPRWLQRLFVYRAIEGYEHPDLIETVFRKTQAYTPPSGWGLVICKRNVLDFGGGCGVHYKRAKIQNPGVRWAVVETPAMAARAKELETERLRFFTTIQDATAWLGQVDLMHSNGAIQYTADPMATVHELCAIGANVMFWDRLYLRGAAEEQWSWLGDNGPGQPIGPEKIVRYRRTPISVRDFIEVHRGYTMRWNGDQATGYRI